jgi:D-3-phosphoglycerate dehydrogenase
MKPVVFLPELIAPAGMDLLREHCELLVPSKEEAKGSEGYRRGLYEADGVVVRLFKVTAEDMEKTSRLKVVGKHGVGVDNIDTAAATAKGIMVVHTPTAPSVPVIEFTIGSMLALGRKLGPADAAIRDDRYGERLKFMGIEFRGKTLGVVGLGEIGGGVAHAASAGLGMKVLGYDPFVDKAKYDGPAVIEDSLEEMLPKVDVLTLHVPLTSGTHHLMNRERLGLLKPECLLINAARGSVVDQDAITEALREERIGGAVLDVFEQEPLPADSPLCTMENVILTPHIGSATPDAMERMAVGAAQGVIDALEGRRPRWVYNRDVLKNL